jgi:hypothetical protein
LARLKTTLPVAEKELVCPRCLKKKGKRVVRESKGKMERHYQKKHPNQKVPDIFYTGPTSYYHERILPYVGPFPVGTRVRLQGVEKPLPEICPECGVLRPTEKKMTKHYKKKHRKLDLPRKPRFWDYVGAELEDLIENNDQKIVGKKATVYSVTPAGYGGPKTPPIIHVKFKKPIALKHLDLYALACMEGELVLLEENE